MAEVISSKGRVSAPVQVKKTQRRRGRKPKSPEAIVDRTGLTLLSVSATDEVVGLAKAEGMERDGFVAGFRNDTTNGAVGIFPAQPGTPNTVGIRFAGQNARQISIHLGDAFDQDEELRPETKVDCKCSVELDATINRLCLWITTHGALPHQTRSRTTKKTQS